MKIRKSFSIKMALVCIVLITLIAICSFTAKAQPISFAQDKILVKFKSGADIANIHAINKTSTLKVIFKINVHVVSIPTGQDIQKMIERFKKNRNVEYAEPDYIVTVDAIPNDLEFSKQWNLNNTGQTGGKSDADIDAPEAWNTQTGDSRIVIAILDTGIKKTHPDLAGKVINEINFSDSGTSDNADDVYGHGTHVAGIAAAVTNNGIGVAGVGYKCSLMNVKVINDIGKGYYDWIANGMIYAAKNGAKVINMSLGGPPSKTIEDAVNYAWDYGVVVVASAGNNNNTEIQYPAYCGNCIAVAATDDNDARASFSTYGDWVDVAAPGDTIYSTIIPRVSKKTTTYYGYMSGTSMSAPHVAGLAGLIWSTGLYTTNNQVRCQILGTADRIAGTGTYWVWGRINAQRAITETVNINDVAVIGVSAPNTATKGTPVDVYVTVQNQGTYDESSVTVSLTDATSPPVNLAPGATTVIHFSWSSSIVGDHTLTASISASKDDDMADNSQEFTIAVVDSGNVMHVDNVDMSWKVRNVGKNIYVHAEAKVTVCDSSNPPVPVDNATVNGHWVIATTNTSTGTTDKGVAILLSDEVRNPASGTTTFRFVVDDVAKEGWVYDKPADPLVSQIVYTKAAPPLNEEYATALGDAYPNPCNPDVWIPFTLSKAENVVVKIYSADGLLVRTLNLGQKLPGHYLASEKAAYWDGRNEANEQVSSGLYFYTIQAGDFIATKKMIIQR
jgi:thermitase